MACCITTHPGGTFVLLPFPLAEANGKRGSAVVLSFEVSAYERFCDSSGMRASHPYQIPHLIKLFSSC
ncbi:MAG: hypothetical protein HUU43_16665 [Ignavibacteriaceae bacterium]|nr:hypothetical protein [Ignavibacteriaceae bacterium]